MIRNLHSVWLTAFAATVALVLSQISNAQPGENGGGGPRGPGGFGPPRVRSGTGFGPGSALATIPEVQKALRLSADQKKQLREINDEFRENFRNLLQAGGAREGVQQLNEDAKAKVAEVLDDDQEKRLRGITIQIMGANAVLMDADLAKELNVTDEQKAKLEEIHQANMREMSEAFRSGTPKENRREEFEARREAHAQKLLDVLTSPQQDQLKELQGEKVKIDMMRLRGGGSGNRTRGGGFGGRGNRDRGDSAEESESKSN